MYSTLIFRPFQRHIWLIQKSEDFTYVRINSPDWFKDLTPCTKLCSEKSTILSKDSQWCVNPEPKTFKGRKSFLLESVQLWNIKDDSSKKRALAHLWWLTIESQSGRKHQLKSKVV